VPLAATVIPSATAATIQAIRRLFQNRSRRRGGKLFAALGGIGVAGIGIALAIPLNDGPSLLLYTVAHRIQTVAAVLAVQALLSVGVGIGKLSRFSKKAEAILIQQYETGKPLLPPIRRRLCQKYSGLGLSRES